MIEGVNVIEEVPVYDGFWMPLLYIVIGLFVIATTIATIWCCKHKWWFCETSERSKINLLANDLTIFLLYAVVILGCMFTMLITDIVLKAVKFEGVKGDTIQYKVQLTSECSFIEFHENYNIIEEYDNNIYLIVEKKK